MDLFCRRNFGNTDRSKDNKSQQFHTTVRQATILRSLNRKTVEIYELELLFCIGRPKDIVQFWVVYLKDRDQLERREEKYALKST